MILDFDGIHPLGPIPPRKYLAKIDHIQETATKQGDPMWEIQWRITTEGEFRGRFILSCWPFSEKAAPLMRIVLQQLGFDVDNKNSWGPSELERLKAIIRVTTQVFQGVERNSVSLMSIKKKKKCPAGNTDTVGWR